MKTAMRRSLKLEINFPKKKFQEPRNYVKTSSVEQKTQQFDKSHMFPYIQNVGFPYPPQFMPNYPQFQTFGKPQGYQPFFPFPLTPQDSLVQANR